MCGLVPGGWDEVPLAQTESSQLPTPEEGAISDPNIEAYSAAPTAISETETLFQPLSTWGRKMTCHIPNFYQNGFKPGF